MPSIPDSCVYLITQQNHSAGRSTVDIVRAAIDAGVDVVQLREKHMTARQRYELGMQLRELTREADIPLIVNDRADLAAAIDADGVHLGDDDLPIETVRAQLGPDAIIGRSVSTPKAAREAAAAGADYLGVGAVYQTTSKDVEPESAEIGLEGIRAIREVTDLPFVGVGGITPERAANVVAAGATGVAAISAITQATAPGSAVAAFTDAVQTGWRER